MTTRRSIKLVPSWIKPILLVAFAALVTGACKEQGGSSGGSPSTGGMPSPSGGGMPSPTPGKAGGGIAPKRKHDPMQGYAVLDKIKEQPTPEMLAARKADVRALYEQRVLGKGPIVAE